MITGLDAQVKCCECGYESNTLENFLFLSLEVTRAASLERALQRFTSCETLDHENKYRCPRQVQARARSARSVMIVTYAWSYFC